MKKIGWHIGTQSWAFRNAVMALKKEMQGYDNVINEKGDINVLFSIDQLGQIPPAYRKKKYDGKI